MAGLNGPAFSNEEQAMTAKKPETVKIVVLRDYWDEDGNRHPKGKIESVAVNLAFDGIEAGQMKRYKD